LGDRGFLSNPEGEHGNILNPDPTTFDELQSIPCLTFLGEPGAGKSWSLSADVDTFRRDGDLPRNDLDLYEKGCSILCEEQNESRRAARRVGSLSPKDRIAVASRIAAATQFRNRFAVWMGTEAAGSRKKMYQWES
jgi:hypothetical protein